MKLFSLCEAVFRGRARTALIGFKHLAEKLKILIKKSCAAWNSVTLRRFHLRRFSIPGEFFIYKWGLESENFLSDSVHIYCSFYTRLA